MLFGCLETYITNKIETSFKKRKNRTIPGLETGPLCVPVFRGPLRSQRVLPCFFLAHALALAFLRLALALAVGFAFAFACADLAAPQDRHTDPHLFLTYTGLHKLALSLGALDPRTRQAARLENISLTVGGTAKPEIQGATAFWTLGWCPKRGRGSGLRSGGFGEEHGMEVSEYEMSSLSRKRGPRLRSK